VEVHLRRLQRQAAEGADRHLQLNVSVIGNTGSGKTTFSRALAEKLGVPHIELDALHWKPGWVESDAEDFRERVAVALAEDGWVCDGNYRGRLGSYVLEHADLVVWLDLPLRVVLVRIVRRTARRVRTREQLWGTNVETWRNFLFVPNPLWWWAFKMHFRWRRRLPELIAPYRHVRLRSSAEVERFLAEV
jgi:adenylate kinase family enzyme